MTPPGAFRHHGAPVPDTNGQALAEALQAKGPPAARFLTTPLILVTLR
jgi:hypothetical protein